MWRDVCKLYIHRGTGCGQMESDRSVASGSLHFLFIQRSMLFRMQEQPRLELGT
jgi:hypothetical protein